MTFKFTEGYSGIRFLDKLVVKNEKIQVVSTNLRPDIPMNVKTNILLQHYGTKH